METAPAWIATSCVMGIDEAGRGPVLGEIQEFVLFISKLDDAGSAAFWLDGESLRLDTARSNGLWMCLLPTCG